MVRRALNLLNHEASGFHQAALFLALSSVGAQLLALVRDRLIASTFGAGETLDIYYAAFRIPDLIFITVGTIVSVTILLPILSEKMAAGAQEARQLLNYALTLFIRVVVSLCVLAFLAMPYLAHLVVPGFSSEATEKFVLLSRILLLSPVLLGLSNLLGTVTQMINRFLVYSLSPVLYNLGIIFGVLLFYPLWGLPGLALGVVVGALMHLLIQWPAVSRSGMMPRLVSRLPGREFRKLISISLPRTLTLASSQITFLVLTSLASVLAGGTITIFNLSYNLQTFTLSVIGTSYAVAALPLLSKFYSAGDIEKFKDYFVRAVRSIIFWTAPATTLFIVLRAQIVRTVLGAGAFDWGDTRLTAAALALFAVSIVAQSLILLFIRGYYAAGKTAVPLIINGLSAGLIIILSFSLTYIFNHYPPFRFFMESLLRVGDLPGTEVLMLSLAYSLGTIANVFVLGVKFKKDFGAPLHLAARGFKEATYAAIIMAAVAYYFLFIFGNLLDTSTLLGIFLQGLLAGVVGIVIGTILLKLLGNDEINTVQRNLTSRFWRVKNIILPEKEEL